MESLERKHKKTPSETEMEIFQKVKARFHRVFREHSEIYSSFLKSMDPGEREAIARRIQSLEEAVIHEVAREYDLSFDEVAEAFFKVDALICEPPIH